MMKKLATICNIVKICFIILIGVFIAVNAYFYISTLASCYLFYSVILIGLEIILSSISFKSV